MILASLISSFYLLMGSVGVEPALAIIQNHHLESVDGRIDFLNGDLRDFVSEADHLNEEIMTLSAQISDMDLETVSEESQDVAAMGDELNVKMAAMLEMLPMLQNAMKIDEDFQQIDAILNKQEPLDDSEKEVLIRIASLCDYVDSRK
jgi:hypothetical protein